MTLPIQICPIMSLTFEAYAKKHIASHLKKLSFEDRYLRFCSGLSDAAIDKYVENLSCVTDGMFVVYDNDVVTAFLHVAQITKNECEFGISVDKNYRQHGYAKALFDRAIVYAQVKDYDTIFMNCLAENSVMRHIVKKRGFDVQSDLQEVTASLKVDTSNQIGAAIIHQAANTMAIYDLAFRTKVHQLKEFMELLRPV